MTDSTSDTNARRSTHPLAEHFDDEGYGWRRPELAPAEPNVARSAWLEPITRAQLMGRR
jgi:hypothetical protein